MPDPKKPDWKELVRTRLAALNLPPGAKEDVIAELSAHLEDSADTGGETNEGEHHTRHQWHKLLRAIERTKREEGRMNHRTKTIWLPAIAILFASGLILMLLDRASFAPFIWLACMAMLLCAAASEANRLNQRTRSLWLPVMMNLTLTTGLFFILDRLNFDEPGIATGGHVGKAFRLPWLVALPVLGAVGALLAKRARASSAERVIAGLAPSLVWLAVLAVVGPILAFDRRDFAGVTPNDFALSAVGLVILPAFALLLGVLPFLRDTKPVAVRQD